MRGGGGDGPGPGTPSRPPADHGSSGTLSVRGGRPAPVPGALCPPGRGVARDVEDEDEDEEDSESRKEEEEEDGEPGLFPKLPVPPR